MFEEKDHKIVTPELVSVKYEIVGAGSRFVGIAMDTIYIQLIALAVYIPLIIAISIMGGWETAGGGMNLAEAVKNSFVKSVLAFMIAFYFVLVWGYHIYFETCREGRTPGKRLAGIQVIRVDGGPISFRDSLLRNLLRIADSLPLFYLVGGLMLLFGKNGQRLGDIVAGTVVIRNAGASYLDVKRKAGTAQAVANETGPASTSPQHRNRLISEMKNKQNPAGRPELTPQEAEIIMNFLNRRNSLPLETRENIAFEITKRICDKYSINFPNDVHPEFILENLISK